MKDEPEDDEYELAQISSTSTASVKDEPNTAKVGQVFNRTKSREGKRGDFRVGRIFQAEEAP